MSVHSNVWITKVDDEAIARAVDRVDPALPLAGRTFAVKDNIDVAGLPTTAACPDFAYTPEHDAAVVTTLRAAGAVVAGKTNMDQFATGLNGTRSPHGPCRSVLAPDRISGGSSSGSAVAVAAGMVDFALGTDTAGSGRVPAACNGVVGLKPTVGLLSIAGIVPACQSLDCPSVFTRTVAEARQLLGVLAPAAARNPLDVRAGVRIAVPDERSLAMLPAEARRAFAATIERIAGAVVVPIDMDPFFAVGDLLYGGAFVAERYHAVGRFIADHPEATNATVRGIILAGRDFSAVDVFEDLHRLAELSAVTSSVLATVDALITPTVPDVPTIEAVLASPVSTNVALGRFTTFVNLLGLAAVASPGAPRADGVPTGVSVVVGAGRDHLALDIAALVEGEPLTRPSVDVGAGRGRIPLAVVGAHLEGQPLHHQLSDRGACLVLRTSTAPSYRLHALTTVPPKPGLERVDDGSGAPIEVEVWSLAPTDFGAFVESVPAPLAIGKIELSDGTWVPGFVCEAVALRDAHDITSTGGWRNYLRASS